MPIYDANTSRLIDDDGGTLPPIHFEQGEASGPYGVVGVLEGAGGWPKFLAVVNDGGFWRIKRLKGLPADAGFELDANGYPIIFDA